ncbi:MAG: DUF3291 domain-containing protein [Alphaproteobacteria bacterium]|nr:DUF3291 domain-containing protein [Alphaproteobacteria bacterium]
MTGAEGASAVPTHEFVKDPLPSDGRIGNMSNHARPPRLSALIAALGVAACSVSTPFSEPPHGMGAAAASDGDRAVVLSVTQITLKNDARSRAKFWRAVALIDETIASQPGFVGYAKRRDLFGRNAWTVSVWSDVPSLAAFIRSDAHGRAMEDAADTFADARFGRTTMPAKRLPPSWDEALLILERKARHYYE